MKKKFKLLLVLVLAVLALSIVGYATWYITRDPQHQGGNFEAYDVDSDEIIVELCDENGITTGTPTNRIIFGRPSSGTNDGWLRYDSNDLIENLVVHIKVSASKAGTYDLVSQLLNSSSEVTTTALFNAPEFTDGNKSNASLSGSTITFSGTNGYIVIHVTYSWGLGSNPYAYFYGTRKGDPVTGEHATKATALLGASWNSGGNKTMKDFAEDYLTALDELCDGITFRVTVQEHVNS